jgi:ribosomal protein L37E
LFRATYAERLQKYKMFNFKRGAPQTAFVLASLTLCNSFAWGFPAEESTTEGEAEAAAADPWAGVRLSGAYDHAKCVQCGKSNELRAEFCSRCGYEFPQPSREMKDPAWVFVPAYGYYKEGTLLEPAKHRKRIWLTGLVVAGLGLNVLLVKEVLGRAADIYYIAGFSVMGVGAGLFIYGFTTRTEAVYAFDTGDRFGPYERPTFAVRSPDSESVAFKVEVTALGF